MCGIVGYVGGREACPVLLKGLHRLEYRGYDSAGVAMVGKDGALNVYKCKGKVSDLEHFLEGKELGGSIGIAHTRWATHGVPNDVNAHPHYSESENIALIHNGIIENYRVLKDALEENGYTFRSSTDSEVLVNLIEYIRTTGGCTLLEAVQQALRQVVGAYAIAVIEKGNRDEIIAARQSSPMAIGIGEGEFFLSSDAASVIEYTQDFVYVNDGDIVRSAAGYNAVSGTEYRKTWEPATGENPQADGDRPVCNWTTEFNVFTGGTSAEYIESVGMKGWGLSGNTSTRPGYIKCGGGGGGIGILYTPELAALPKNTTVTVSFSASAYAEGENVYGSDIVVEAIEGAEFGSNNSVSKKGTAVASKVVDISSAVGRFETFTVTLDGLSPTSRIAFSSNPAQAGANKTRYLLDDIVVVYDGETRLEKLTVPANVKFDAEAVYSDKLTLEWDEVAGAASYTVAWWADGTEKKDATVAEGITSASYLLKELEAGTEYHAKVKACRYNNPDYDSDYSAAVSQKTDIAPVQAGIVVSKVLATSSTLTVEWARADGQACVNSSAQVYHVKLYSDAECKDLFVGWNASNVFGITAGNRFRFTFSGLAPATTYYVCVDDKTNDFFSDPLAYATAAAGPQAGATAPGSAKAGDILLAEDFSKVIHGGDIANFAAGYYPPSSNRGTYAAASGDNPSGFSATRCTANEFDLFSGGGVAAPYTEGTGLSAWGKSGNIAGRPGYVKMGAGSAAASLYTPELTALPDAATVKVRFSAQAYSEKYDGSGADAGKILVKAVRGAVLGAKGAITGTVTEVSAADPVDISAAKARFREFEATLTNVTPDCRIVISTSEKRALLDNVVVTCTAITPATKPAAPGGVSFDAAAAADRLTLKWNAVPDATSYTVAYWKGSASAPESEYAYKTGIASTATSQELTNLESNTSYWAKVKAVGSLDSDWSETANATTMDSGGEPLLPTADLLDVVFRNDGSAMDNSSSATPVRRMPSSRP